MVPGKTRGIIPCIDKVMKERCFPLITNTLLFICLKMLIEQMCSDLLDDEVGREWKEGFGSYGWDC